MAARRGAFSNARSTALRPREPAARRPRFASLRDPWEPLDRRSRAASSPVLERVRGGNGTVIHLERLCTLALGSMERVWDPLASPTAIDSRRTGPLDRRSRALLVGNLRG